MMKLEICTGSYNSVLAALQGGAHRVELCSGLQEGGLTPSAGLIRAVCSLPHMTKHVLIRPRGGDFLYNTDEKRIMLDDIRTAQRLGADGVVVGALTADGHIDLDFLKECVNTAQGLQVTFHRAFDLCASPLQALEQIIAAGCSHLLTSGQAATAEEGIPLLRTLVSKAGKDLIIMPGCGVSPQNAARIVRETGATEIHASARSAVNSAMTFRLQGVEMGKGSADEYTTWETDSLKVKEIIKELESLNLHGKPYV